MAEQTYNSTCSCLRTKSSYAAFGEYQQDLEEIMGATSTFWCLKTMSKAGPDEHYVHASICREGRRCWENPEA